MTKYEIVTSKQLEKEFYEVEGRIAVVKSSLINAARGLVFLTDRELTQTENELNGLEEQRDRLLGEIKKADSFERNGWAYRREVGT